MFRIIGGDQKEYGPVTAEDLRRWAAEGRVNARTPVQAEGTTEWQPLSAFPEFADIVASSLSTPGALPVVGGRPGLPEDILTRDYDLDIGGCVGKAWELLKNNFGLVFGGVAVYLLIQCGMSMVAQIPIVGILVSVGSLIITGPLTGGVYYFLLKVIRGQGAEIGDVFAGFRLAFANLLLGYIVVTLLTCLAMLPGIAIMAFPIAMMAQNNAAEVGPVLLALVGFIVVLIPAVYLAASWMFSLPLIIDKQMDFWPAMGASRRMVGKHWWLVVGLAVVCGLINCAGFLACCVGIFVTLPLTFSAMMYAYESIFSAPASQAA
ncbi:MAG TPA: GYF domain-containing protein [Candidatus Paceibacterota bacterium]|nr:GYF domain-containing protein [Verrucomicrobiota bacterium]HSA11418.1 GYF domain-containing protein [Candidatus Paceibacterota bacterium]